ncbi:MAG TPA: RNA 2',3'-cyclic phosphodiesterase [Acidimicrobiia bacterium]|nr:RNA 2',3'-cyclic phosphodiesterase [Acidimicrobiia bacterium]
MEGVARLFVAVALDDDARHRLAHDLGDPGGWPGRPVRPQNWHLTLRFLGDTDQVAADRLFAALDEADLGHPFRFRWSGLGAFPTPRKATVLWVGVGEGSEPLERLAEQTRTAVEDAGFAPEDRPFAPHLTLSRIRPPADVRSLIEGLEAPGGSVAIGEVVVYRSRLGSGGARYEVVERFPL